MKNLKILRNERKNTQQEMATLLGIARSTYTQYETGVSQPDNDTIIKLANYFGVAIDYLLGKTAFKNGFELFEHWGYSPDGFEAAFDFGKFLKNERKEQGITQEEVSEALNITVSDVENIEAGILPLNYEWAEKYSNFLGTSVPQIFFDNNMHDEQVPEHFNGNVDAYLSFKKAVDDDALSEPPLDESMLLNTYRQLSSPGKSDVRNFAEYTLAKERQAPIKEKPASYLNAAHAIEGASDEENNHDDDIMDDENF